MTFIEKLEEIRLQRNMSKADFVKLIGVSRSIYARYCTEHLEPRDYIARHIEVNLGLEFGTLLSLLKEN